MLEIFFLRHALLPAPEKLSIAASLKVGRRPKKTAGVNRRAASLLMWGCPSSVSSHETPSAGLPAPRCRGRSRKAIKRSISSNGPLAQLGDVPEGLFPFSLQRPAAIVAPAGRAAIAVLGSKLINLSAVTI